MFKQQLFFGLLYSYFALPLVLHGESPGEWVFQDHFAGPLAEGWSWEREDRTAWRTGPVGLEVRVQPGNMWGPANNAKNVLIRPIPTPTDVPVEISVTFSNAPTAQWEQANLVWYYDASNMVKLGQELVTGRFSIVMGREENDRARTIAIIPLDDNTVELRLQAVNQRVRGQFRTRHWNEWRDVGECDLPVKGDPKASLHFYNGPAKEEHWIKVNRFTVRRLTPQAVDWPRVRASEQIYRITANSLVSNDMATLSLGSSSFVLINDPRSLADVAKVDSEQRIFRHQDGSYGWSWDRRASSKSQPMFVGVGLGHFGSREHNELLSSLERLGEAYQIKPLEMDLNAVTRLENDEGNHNLSVQIGLTTKPDGLLEHRISIWFDWYGKEATQSSLNDGDRSYAYIESASKSNESPVRYEYRIQGFRGAPPKVNLQAFVTDAVKRGLPKSAKIVGIWFGNEVWDGSRGGTLVTQFVLVIDGRRYASVP